MTLHRTRSSCRCSRCRCLEKDRTAASSPPRIWRSPSSLVGVCATGDRAETPAWLKWAALEAASAVALHRPAGSEIATTGAQTLAYLNIVWPALLYMRQSLHDSWQPCSGKESSNRNLPQQLRALP
jgi:hypothetical protein